MKSLDSDETRNCLTTGAKGLTFHARGSQRYRPWQPAGESWTAAGMEGGRAQHLSSRAGDLVGGCYASVRRC